MKKRTVSTAEAAAILGTKPQRVRVLLKLGRIPGAYRGRTGYHAWKIPLQDDGSITVTPSGYRPAMRYVRGEKPENEALSPAEV